MKYEPANGSTLSATPTRAREPAARGRSAPSAPSVEPAPRRTCWCAATASRPTPRRTLQRHPDDVDLRLLGLERTPPVWVWKRIFIVRLVGGLEALPHDLRPHAAHRAELPPWNTLLWQLKKNASRGPNSSTFSPALSAASTYAIAFESVNPGLPPSTFSRMWYPEIEIVFHFGTFSRQ